MPDYAALSGLATGVAQALPETFRNLQATRQSMQEMSIREQQLKMQQEQADLQRPVLQEKALQAQTNIDALQKETARRAKTFPQDKIEQLKQNPAASSIHNFGIERGIINPNTPMTIGEYEDTIKYMHANPVEFEPLAKQTWEKTSQAYQQSQIPIAETEKKLEAAKAELARSTAPDASAAARLDVAKHEALKKRIEKLSEDLQRGKANTEQLRQQADEASNLYASTSDHAAMMTFLQENKDVISAMPQQEQNEVKAVANMRGAKVDDVRQVIQKYKPETGDAFDKNMTEEQLIARSLAGDKRAKAILDERDRRAKAKNTQTFNFHLAEAEAKKKLGEQVSSSTVSKADAVMRGLDSAEVKGMKGGQATLDVQRLVREQYPDFNFSLNEANQKWIKSSQNQKVIAQVKGVLPRISALAGQADKIQNGNFPAINSLMNIINRQTGRPEVSTFEANRNAIVQEVNTALSGSSTGSDLRVQLELENLKSASSPAQFAGALQNLQAALESRLDATISVPYPLDVVRGEKSVEQFKKEQQDLLRGVKGKSSTKAVEKGSYQNYTYKVVK